MEEGISESEYSDESTILEDLIEDQGIDIEPYH